MVSKYLADVSQRFIPPLVYGCILYWALGLNPAAANFFVFLGFLLITRLVGESLGMAICAVTPSVEAAQALTPPTVIISLLFGGFYINQVRSAGSRSAPPRRRAPAVLTRARRARAREQENLPVYLAWLRYLSGFFWAFAALLRNEFAGESFRCRPTEDGCSAYGLYSGDRHLRRLGFERVTMAQALLGLMLLHCSYLLITFLALRFLSKPRYIAV